MNDLVLFECCSVYLKFLCNILNNSPTDTSPQVQRRLSILFGMGKAENVWGLRENCIGEKGRCRPHFALRSLSWPLMRSFMLMEQVGSANFKSGARNYFYGRGFVFSIARASLSNFIPSMRQILTGRDFHVMQQNICNLTQILFKIANEKGVLPHH